MAGLQCPKCNYFGDSNQVGEHLVYFHNRPKVKPKWEPQYFMSPIPPKNTTPENCPMCQSTLAKMGYKLICGTCEYTFSIGST